MSLQLLISELFTRSLINNTKTMRIISGKHKGKRLTAPKNLPVRPTTDMAKESLFNILNNHYYFDEIKVLDLFGGIGSISFEFASRGTKNITTVDQHQGCIRYINSVNAQLELNIDTIKSDVYQFLEKCSQQYDIIFADPPYNFTLEQLQKLHHLVFSKNLLSIEGLLIIEHSNQISLEDLPYFDKSKKYGGNKFSFFNMDS